jgi:hypothetical protein
MPAPQVTYEKWKQREANEGKEEVHPRIAHLPLDTEYAFLHAQKRLPLYVKC